MPNNEEPLKIIIVGRPKSGKTTMMVLLTEFLLSHGLQVSVVPDPYEREEARVRVLGTMPQRLESMRGKPISIEMRQARRGVNLMEPMRDEMPGDIGERP